MSSDWSLERAREVENLVQLNPNISFPNGELNKHTSRGPVTKKDTSRPTNRDNNNNNNNNSNKILKHIYRLKELTRGIKHSSGDQKPSKL